MNVSVNRIATDMACPQAIRTARDRTIAAFLSFLIWRGQDKRIVAKRPFSKPGYQSPGVNFSKRPWLSPRSSSSTQSAPSGPSATLRIRAPIG